MTIVETMVAAVILSAGVLGVFVMVETADRVSEHNRSRTNASAVARELLEEARAVPFRTIGAHKWFDDTLKALAGGSGTVTNPSTDTARTTVTRAKVGYAVEVYSCSFDAGRDGHGNHSGSVHWCPDSTATDAVDGQPEDLKRVAVTLRWTGPNGKAETLYQTATFGSGGQLIGPALTDLKLTSPAVADQQNPVITANPTDPPGIARFSATAPGAAEMRFFVDGVEQPPATVTGPSGSSWTFDWNITSLKDGLYQISAVAIDALGARGAPRVMNVRLARNVPAPAANLTGGYNDVFAAGSKTRVVELAWDASAEGSVTGYEVWKGATKVCAASLRTECMDLAPATSGSTTYTVKTLYTDGAGNPGSVSTTYTVTAPAGGGSAIPNKYGLVNTTLNPTAKCIVIGAVRDAVTNYPTSGGTSTSGGGTIAGCGPALTSAASLNVGNVVFEGWYTNSNTKSTCTANITGFLYVNGTYANIGSTTTSGTSTWAYVPPNTTTPTKYSMSWPVTSSTARSLVSGDVISFYVNVGGAGSGCNGSVRMYFGSGAHQTTLTLPLTGAGGGGGAITRPAPPSGLTATKNVDGTVTLRWEPPAGTPPAEFYRIYRDGEDYTQRFETAGETGLGTIEWTDTDTASAHTYRVTAVSNVLAESDFAGPVTQ